MQKRRLWAPILAMCFAFQASAQFNGSIEGTVSDASSASVPDAQVTLVQVATGVTQRAVTIDNGFFRITQLPPGSYRLEVSRTGFKTWVQTDLVLTGAEARTVYPVLTVGEQVSHVEVTAAANAIATDLTDVRDRSNRRRLRRCPAWVAMLTPVWRGSHLGSLGLANDSAADRRMLRIVFRTSRDTRSTRPVSGRNRTSTKSMVPA